VSLDGSLVDAEVTGDLLVQAPTQDLAEHFSLSRSDGLEEDLHGPALAPLFARLGGVNYLVRPATTILAGWRRGMISL